MPGKFQGTETVSAARLENLEKLKLFQWPVWKTWRKVTACNGLPETSGVVYDDVKASGESVGEKSKLVTGRRKNLEKLQGL
ncbi:MAG: hypothetical protein LBD28_01960 [Tannerellaceae bacterium]|nr:hypothetical protein [Tannerellaceae bacterium]